jgi:outer membrane protein assembly factor BamB
MRLFLVFSFLLLASCSHMKMEAPKRVSPVFKVAWSKSLEPDYQTGNLPIGTGAPRIFNETLFMGSLKGHMTAYDLETGRPLWSHFEKTPLGAAVEFFNDHVIYGGLNGRVFARHYLTGELKYSVDLGAPVENAPVFHHDRLTFYLRGHQIVHLDAETGKVLWAYKRAVPVTTTLQRTTVPLIIGNKVIVGFADGFVAALSRDEGLLVWETKIVENAKFVDVDLNPLLVGGLVVTGSPSGQLKAIHPDTGVISKSYDFNVQAHPLIMGEQIILGTVEGEVVIINHSGEVLKRAQISKQSISAITWWKDTLIAASFDGRIYAIDPLNMAVKENFALGYDYSAVYSDLVTSGETLALYSSRNRLYVFK